MASGAKLRPYRGSYIQLPHMPSVCILGHSIPRRVFDNFDQIMLTDSIGLEMAMGQLTLGQAYAKYLKCSDTFYEINFISCPSILSSNFLPAVTQVGNMRPDIVICQIGTNDLCGEVVSPHLIANAMLGTVTLLRNHFNIDLIVFLSELKREDVPDEQGHGHLMCSIDDFRTRIIQYNDRIEHECSENLEYKYRTLPGFWQDSGKNEVPVKKWSSDNLHPGPDVESWGFRKYVKSIRETIWDALPTVCLIKELKGKLP